MYVAEICSKTLPSFQLYNYKTLAQFFEMGYLSLCTKNKNKREKLEHDV